MYSGAIGVVLLYQETLLFLVASDAEAIQPRRDCKMSCVIHLNYTDRSHVLTGDFNSELAYFNDGVLKEKEWMRYGSYKVGKGWCFSKKRLEEVKEELSRSGIDVEELETDEEQRGQGRRKKEELAEPEEVTIHLNYTPKSHVLTGGFRQRYKDFKLEVLRGKSGFRGGKYRVGPGWVFAQARLHELKDALDGAEIPYREIDASSG